MTDPSKINAPFCVEVAEPEAQAAALADPHTLAVFRFDAAPALDPAQPRLIQVGLPALDQSTRIEIWRSPHVAETGQDGLFTFCRTPDLLLVHALVDEADYPSLEDAVEHLYQEFFAVLERQGYPHQLRVWNYFHDINRESRKLERYRSFCLGRHRVLEAIPDFERTLPAATAIGSHSPGLQLFALAAREPGEQIENPRQVSAFKYPEQYGPRSPSFSRATVKRWGGQSHFYISGTASIVGHESRHTDDAVQQLDEIIANIDALLGEAHRVSGLGLASPTELSLLKVYVRDPEEMPRIRERVEQHLGSHVPVIYLHGDICRADLLVEIEAIYTGDCAGVRPD